MRARRTRGLPPVRYPEGWPVETYSLTPLRAALLAEDAGLLRELSRELFALAFVRGPQPRRRRDRRRRRRSRAGMDARGRSRGPRARGRQAAPARARPRQAMALGVTGVPTIAVGERLFWGDDRSRRPPRRRRQLTRRRGRAPAARRASAAGGVSAELPARGGRGRARLERRLVDADVAQARGARERGEAPRDVLDRLADRRRRAPRARRAARRRSAALVTGSSATFAGPCPAPASRTSVCAITWCSPYQVESIV